MKAFVKPDIISSYLRYKEINEYLDYLRDHYGDVVKICTIGRSYQGRQIRGIHIDWQKRHRTSKTGKVGSPKKNLVFIEAGTHAREWMTIAVALKCIQQLTEKHMRHKKLLEKLRFFIVPVANPDGYEYTYNENPMWRKNRRPHSVLKSIGTDCNRNFDFHWENGSTKANRGTFKGEKPFSEPETRALKNILEKLRPQLLLFLSLHSYGQAIMYPWGFTLDLPISWKELHKVAECGTNALKRASGREYRCGSISTIRKHTYFGSIVDYVFGVIKVPFALVLELPSHELGFQPSAINIRPVGNESWSGIKAMCLKACDLLRNMPSIAHLKHSANQNQDVAKTFINKIVSDDVTMEKLPSKKVQINENINIDVAC